MARNDETNSAAIGERLRWAREQAGLTQTQIARLLNYHRPTISQIEAGQRVVRPDEIARFASLYGVEETWIIHGDKQPGGQPGGEGRNQRVRRSQA